MHMVLGIFYVLAGILLAIPYCLLAGWKAENFMIVAFVAPAFFFVWFMTATYAGIIEPGHRRTIHFNWRAAFRKSDRRMLPGSLAIFWGWTVYSFLPIILHWGAALLGKVGYETVGSILDTHRYASPLYALIATLMLLILTTLLTNAVEGAKNVLARRR